MLLQRSEVTAAGFLSTQQRRRHWSATASSLLTGPLRYQTSLQIVQVLYFILHHN